MRGSTVVKNPWTGLKYVHVNFMFNLQHFAIHNVSSAILYGAIGIDLLVANIAIYCGELPAANWLFFVKKTKDNRTWVADQEPVNMKRPVEP